MYKSIETLNIPKGRVFVINKPDEVIKRGDSINIDGESYIVKEIELFRSWPSPSNKIGILV